MNMDSIDGSLYLTVKIHICLTIQLTYMICPGRPGKKLCQLPNLGTKACRLMVETKALDWAKWPMELSSLLSYL
jgi:hypothetical protein